jgi:hypothetical protein
MSMVIDTFNNKISTSKKDHGSQFKPDLKSNKITLQSNQSRNNILNISTNPAKLL